MSELRQRSSECPGCGQSLALDRGRLPEHRDDLGLERCWASLMKPEHAALRIEQENNE